MANRLRLARHPVAAYSPAVGVAAPDAGLHKRLQSLIRHHLSPVTAALLAEPKESGDGLYIEWYTDLAGQPVPLHALPQAEQEKVRALLRDRLSALGHLARGSALGEADAPLAPALLQATTYPGDETVYVVGGQPVLTFWGYGSLPEEPPPAPVASAAPETRRSTTWRRLAWVLGLLALAALVYAGLRFWPGHWPPWGPDYAALLAAANDEEAALGRQLLVLNSDLARALGRCALQARLSAMQEEEGFLSQRLEGVEATLAGRIRACREAAALDSARDEETALAEALQALRTQLAEKLKACPVKTVSKPAERPQQPAKQEPKPSPTEEKPGSKEEKPRAADAGKPKQAKREGLPPCPGERPPEDAPDVAIVLDASGSMRLPERMTAAQQSQYAACRQQVPNPLLAIMQQLTCYSLFESYGGATRLQAAQRSVSTVVSSLPLDVDVGLTVLEDCPRASDFGFFGASQRQRLLQGVNQLMPRRGTPLANGLWIAGQKVDGVRAPAVVVVISDGEDSCRQDPCAVARRLKAQKPQLQINVVDITGDGAANCLAKSTGGRVLSSTSGMPMDQMIREAAAEAQKPAHCK